VKDRLFETGSHDRHLSFMLRKCPACEAEAVTKEMAGRLIVLKVDTEREQRVAAEFRIQSIPYFIVFRNGRQVSQRSGAAPRAELRRWVENQG
jgi:thioredoxin-like negative regulator of GroEL